MILVTGATGNVGRKVVAALRSRGAALRAASREGDGEDGVPLDYADRGTWDAALRGADALFLLMPGGLRDLGGTLLPFLSAARAAGVRQTVFLSVAGAETSPLMPHRKVEREVRSGPHTILRPTYFAQNLEWAYPEDVRRGRLVLPAGRGEVAFVDLRDVGEVAAMALTDPAAHQRRAYHLTGPRAFTFGQVADALTEHLGHAVEYAPVDPLRYALHLRRRGTPPAMIAVQTWLHVGLRFGQAAAVDPTLGRLLGRAPFDLRDYVRDHAAIWRRD
ncbi:MAG: NmrA family NAD(P)-binding protein [Hasllibacter sp.]